MAIFYRVGDTQPPLRVEVQDLGQPIDITNLSVMVTWVRPDGTYISEREATKVDIPNGFADYDWENTDLTIEGSYRAQVRLKASDNSYYSLTDPPHIGIEVLANPLDPPSTALDDTIPLINGYDIAVQLQIPTGDLDENYTQAAISRARTLAYVLCQMWRGPGPLVARDQWLMKELVKMLAAREYVTNPAIVYGAFKSETIGSYQYQLKDKNSLESLPTGIPNIDGLIEYFVALMSIRGDSIDIAFPDWYQPATTRIWDPADPSNFQVDQTGSL